MFHTGVPYFGYTEQEVKEVFTALYPRLCAYIDGVIGRGDLGDDIIQEIFYKFLRRRPCLDRAKVPSYLFSMAHNECLNWLRRNKILYNSVDLNKLQESRAWETLALCDFLDAPNDSPLATLLIEEVLALCDRLRARLREIPGVRILCDDGQAHMAITSIVVPGHDGGALADALDAADIAVRAGLHCAPAVHAWLGTLQSGAIRFSPGLYNTAQEMDDTALLLARLLQA